MPDGELDTPQPTRIQRMILLLAIRLVRRFRHKRGSVLMLTNDLCVKYGSRLDLVEAQNMIYIAKNTSIPVPKVYLAFKHEDCTYILMQRIHGQMLGTDWVYRPPASKLIIHVKLKALIDEMRKLSTKSNAICSVSGGSLYDPRLPTTTERFGPFMGVQEFHDYLRNGIKAHKIEEVVTLIDLHGQQWESPIFTHGDLSSLNILARGDDVVGIIDWETAGWFPSYWEYTTACQVNPQNSFWRDEIDNFLEAMPKALAMERLRQWYFGDF